ncbi:hypothetical protein VNO80_09371 [Phaseolus coccineus]|uniref:Uncharacterized protein n=1 Tax=Phaseolus coccineus TaxID=3886 RepID=A0AAN9N6C9_PHACN
MRERHSPCSTITPCLMQNGENAFVSNSGPVNGMEKSAFWLRSSKCRGKVESKADLASQLVVTVILSVSSANIDESLFYEKNVSHTNICWYKKSLSK